MVIKMGRNQGLWVASHALFGIDCFEADGDWFFNLMLPATHWRIIDEHAVPRKKPWRNPFPWASASCSPAIA